jgi:hypothetical protein
MRKTFIHPFHNTAVTLNVTDGSFLTDSQTVKLERELCGMSECRCNFYPVESDDSHWSIYKSGEVLADEVARAAAALGRKGGQSTSKAKSQAARKNGRKGGRPRKSK